MRVPPGLYWIYRYILRGRSSTRNSWIWNRGSLGSSVTDHNMVAFPAFKLGALLLKQVSKPLANVVKARAKSSPFFRTYICMPPAQFYHWCEVKLKMWSMNLGKPVNIPKLNENMAIDLGAELLGEGIIFTIASGVLIYEYVRSSRKEAQKELERKEDMEKIHTELKDLYFSTARQDAQIRELVRILRISLPSANYSDPQSIDMSSIPDHHRFGHQKEEETSLWSTLNNALWSAVELIIPPTESKEAQKSSPHQIVVVPSGSGTPTPSGSASQSSATAAVTKNEASQSPPLDSINNNVDKTQTNTK